MKNENIDSIGSAPAGITGTPPLAASLDVQRKRAGYADPPYIGQARRHYSHDPRCAEVDHRQLIARLNANYDCWALSCSAPSLLQIWALCPEARLGIWVKTFAAFKTNPAFAYEPVLFKGCLSRDGRFFVRDWVAERITMRRGLHGAKPERFCYWVFEMLGLQPEDEFDDIYPGTGAVSRAWVKWRDFEIQRRITGEPVGLYAQEKDLALFAHKPNRLGSIARLMGHKGGRSTSDAKARAARSNGALGGRPRKARKTGDAKHDR